ncbi:MAG: HNH endonuclease signature motif containing protein [Candidatus Thiodiazotropha sp.]
MHGWDYVTEAATTKAGIQTSRLGSFILSTALSNVINPGRQYDMFSFIRFVIRNPSYVTRDVRRAWKTRKAMNEFRDRPENSLCAWCGRKKRLEVHHIEPVSVSPDKADDPSNMIMLCRKPACHQIIGHNGNFANSYVENVKDICADDKQMVVKVVNSATGDS